MKNNEFSYNRIVFHERNSYGEEQLTDENVVEHYKGSISGIEYEKQSIYNQGAVNDRSFLNGMKKCFDVKTFSGLLFPAVRYSIPGLLVFERPPTNKMVQYVDLPVDLIRDEVENNIHAFNLPLPWQLYVAEYNVESMLLTKVHMYFMNESFKGGDQIMYLPPLPNFFANGSLCRPYLATMEDIERYEKSLSGIMASAYDWIWNSGFNHDLVEGPLSVYYSRNTSFNDPKYIRRPANSSWQRYVHPLDVLNIYKIWEKRSLDDVLEIVWPNVSITPIWDGETEWFYNNNPDYPYDFVGAECEEYDTMEEYSENYPVRLHELPKPFKIMIAGIIGVNYSLFGPGKKLNYNNRFTVYSSIAAKLGNFLN